MVVFHNQALFPFIYGCISLMVENLHKKAFCAQRALQVTSLLVQPRNLMRNCDQNCKLFHELTGIVQSMMGFCVMQNKYNFILYVIKIVLLARPNSACPQQPATPVTYRLASQLCMGTGMGTNTHTQNYYIACTQTTGFSAWTILFYPVVVNVEVNVARYFTQLQLLHNAQLTKARAQAQVRTHPTCRHRPLAFWCYHVAQGILGYSPMSHDRPCHSKMFS